MSIPPPLISGFKDLQVTGDSSQNARPAAASSRALEFLQSLGSFTRKSPLQSLMSFHQLITSTPIIDRNLACDFIISPPEDLINRLPFEILLIIFTICCDDGVISSDVIRRTVQTNVLLSHVCRNWRDVVCRSPRLWSTIIIKFMSEPERTLARIRTYIERSGTRPLDIVWTEFGYRRQMGMPVIRELFSTSHRWRTLDFQLPPHAIDYFDAHPIVGGCPQLESASISLSHWDPVDAQRFIDQLHLAQPEGSLTALTWRGDGDSRLPSTMPWAQLKRLSLDAKLSVEDVCTVLKHCTSGLRDLYIGNLVQQRGDFDDFDMDALLGSPSIGSSQDNRDHSCDIILQSLEKLTVVTADASKHLFNRLQVPVLRALRVESSNWARGPIHHQELERLLRRSMCTVRSLKLDDPNIDEDYLLVLLQQETLQHLQCLDIQQPMVTSTLLSLLTPDYSWAASPTMPELRTLRLGDCHSSDQNIAKLVRTRTVDAMSDPNAHGVHRLRVLDVAFTDERHKHPMDIKWVEHCAERTGLDHLLQWRDDDRPSSFRPMDIDRF
ncbi:hypothetical protein HGRIS_000834 [Hohenbuehelia grisea]|uniref:F-box domain-containing protein n=1 Tax=Hohenbuehelia grisea TaxID=104357 RepID=A0ABR3IPV9_9AGAR